MLLSSIMRLQRPKTPVRTCNLPLLTSSLVVQTSKVHVLLYKVSLTDQRMQRCMKMNENASIPQMTEKFCKRLYLQGITEC